MSFTITFLLFRHSFFFFLYISNHATTFNQKDVIRWCQYVFSLSGVYVFHALICHIHYLIYKVIFFPFFKVKRNRKWEKEEDHIGLWVKLLLWFTELVAFNKLFTFQRENIYIFYNGIQTSIHHSISIWNLEKEKRKNTQTARENGIERVSIAIRIWDTSLR